MDYRKREYKDFKPMILTVKVWFKLKVLSNLLGGFCRVLTEVLSELKYNV